MKDTHFYLPEGKRDRFAVTYMATQDADIKRAPDTSNMTGQGEYADGPSESFSGGAGLLSTAEDYGRFLQSMLDGGKLDNVRILGRASVDLMTSNHIEGIKFSPGSGFGLGFSVSLDLGARGVPGSVGEFSWGGAYHTTYWADPKENLVVVYMTQLRPALGIDDTRKLRAIIYQALD
jgi:CubicO group peptidase (beta-lactamase class C family)